MNIHNKDINLVQLQEIIKVKPFGLEIMSILGPIKIYQENYFDRLLYTEYEYEVVFGLTGTPIQRYVYRFHEDIRGMKIINVNLLEIYH